MSVVVQPLIEIPDKFIPGLTIGKYIREGSIIRNQQGRIVKHLGKIPNSNNSTSLVKTVTASNTLKNSLIGIGVIVGVSTLALGAYKVYQKFREKNKMESKRRLFLMDLIYY